MTLYQRLSVKEIRNVPPSSISFLGPDWKTVILEQCHRPTLENITKLICSVSKTFNFGEIKKRLLRAGVAHGIAEFKLWIC